MEKKKVLLIHLPQWSIDQPPLGISYVGEFSKKYGYEVNKRDLSIELYAALPEGKRYILESNYHLHWLEKDDYITMIYPEIEIAVDEWAEELASNDAGVLGFSLLSTNWIPSLQVIQKIKEINPEKIIVIGGPHVARYEAAKELIENEYVDFAVPGEGEVTFKELLDAINGTQEFEKVTGILYKKGNKIIDTGIRPCALSLDDFPHPTFEEYPLSLYRSLAIPILGSRGCLFHCAFCSEKTFWDHYRSRSGVNLFEEIKYHYETTGQHYYYIVDSLINGNIPELEKFCDLLIESKMPVAWGGKASIRKQMTEQLLTKMHKAGCVNIEYGIESASAKVLKDMNKVHDPATASEVLRNTARAGVKAGLFWIIGFPTETEADFQESMQFLKDNVQHVDHVTPGYGCGIQKGSDLFNNPKKYGIYFKHGDWYSQYTSPEIRARRIRTFRDFCVSLGYKID